MRQFLSFLALTGVLFFPYNALAYIDPGTGSYIVQIIIAAAVGGAFAVKTFWNNIKAFFYKLFNKPKVNDEFTSENKKLDD